MYPELEEFEDEAGRVDRITVYRETDADMDTPVSILSRLLALPRTALLESAKGDKTYSRFSFLAFDMEKRLTLTHDGLYKDGQRIGELSYLEEDVNKTCGPSAGSFGDFRGGYIGYFNYKFVGACDILRRPLTSDGGVLGAFYLVERWLVYDNYTNKAFLALSRKVDDSQNRKELFHSMSAELEATEKRLDNLPRMAAIPGKPVVTRCIPRASFMNKVRTIKEMIEEGEAIQVVLSDYLIVKDIDPFDFYRNLRRINPSPYMFFLKDEDSCIVGSSPEVHIKIADKKAILKPIAGTKPRTSCSSIDAIIRELAEDEKEKAEHLMLVDLARNDLSRICATGSVRVESFMEPEVYSHVVHLVSLVRGDLADGIGPIEAIRRTFPAGTVSGAPKTRAIEIIDDIEENERGAYAGCLGYIGFDGNVNMAITIRTAFFFGRTARLHAGAGIVYDSVPEKEYEEVFNKLGALIRAGGIDDSIDR